MATFFPKFGGFEKDALKADALRTWASQEAYAGGLHNHRPFYEYFNLWISDKTQHRRRLSISAISRWVPYNYKLGNT